MARKVSYPEVGWVTRGDGNDPAPVGVHVARGFFDRLRGLMGVEDVEPSTLMVFGACSSIHTMWMRTPIDVAWLDEPDESGSMRVLRVDRAVLPWRVRGCAQAWGCAEAAPGWLSRLLPERVSVPELGRAR